MRKFRLSKSNPRIVVDSMGGVYRAETGGRFPVRNNRGYTCGTIWTGNGNVDFKVHRAVAEAFVSGYSCLLDVDHINGNKADNRALNLEMVTRQENMKRAAALGLMPRGDRNGSAKITNAQAAEIASLRESHSLKEISAKLGISEAQVSRIANGKSRVLHEM